MRLYRTTEGAFVEHNQTYFAVSCESWDELIRADDIPGRLQKIVRGAGLQSLSGRAILAPVVSQDVWAAGVTYYSSRRARMEESKDSGGGTFYDRVYHAERPELFFKCKGPGVVGPGNHVRIRSDAKWSVPEPELTLVVNPAGTIIGYTIGNDMSSRDIEGENPLYLPQAKVYDRSCAVGPCILIGEDPVKSEAAIRIQIKRNGQIEFEGATSTKELKRRPQDLVDYLFRDLSFPDGVLLMSGTGIVPADNFTLDHGDVIRISIDGIGTLENAVA